MPREVKEVSSTKRSQLVRDSNPDTFNLALLYSRESVHKAKEDLVLEYYAYQRDGAWLMEQIMLIVP